MSAQLHAVDDRPGLAEMEIQQDRHQPDLVPARDRHERVEVGEDRRVEAERYAGAIEPDTGSRVAEQERPHDRHAVTAKRGKGPIQQIERGLLGAQSSSGNQALAPMSAP